MSLALSKEEFTGKNSPQTQTEIMVNIHSAFNCITDIYMKTTITIPN
jgi:hypothetical protein